MSLENVKNLSPNLFNESDNLLATLNCKNASMP